MPRDSSSSCSRSNRRSRSTLRLAVERENENPVYYVQYGHARIASVLRRADAGEVDAARTASLAPLDASRPNSRSSAGSPSFRDVVAGVVEHLAPHRLARYARDVASDFHQFYTECQILDDDRGGRVWRAWRSA